MNIGDKIRKIRKEKKITIVELASMTGLSKTTISDTETGKTNPTNESILKISKALDINIQDLCRDTGSFFFFFDDEEINLTNETKEKIPTNSDCKQRSEENIDLKFTDPIKAMEFILSQPTVGDYGNFDVNKLTDEDKINFANDLLEMIRMISPKYTK